MKLAVFGASGFAREVRDIALVLGYKEIIYIEKNEGSYSKNLTVVMEQDIQTLIQKGYKFVIGIGDPKIRKRIWQRYPYLTYVNLIHPTASFGYEQLNKVEKRIGNIICAGVRMTNGIQVGNFGIYYLNCTITHDCVIEDFVTIASGANISGNVKLSSNAYIGANACILQGKSLDEKMIIGKNAIVGAGAVVTKNVPEHRIVKGNPAKCFELY